MNIELRRVVVTGMGVISPVGNTVDDFWENLVKGQSGVDRITLFDTSDFNTKIGAEVKDFNPEDFLDRKEVRRMDRFTHFAIAASDQAIADSGLNFENVARERVGVIVGSGIGGMATFETQAMVLMERGPRRVSPFFIPMMISDIAPGHISIRHGLKGPNFSTVSACASSSHAIGEAFRNIQLDAADIVVCGGAEACITKLGVAGFNAMKALSTRNDEPQKASRPFDIHRDGFVMGEGSGILVLESLKHAKERGARIYAEVGGIGYSADAYHITAPAPEGEGATTAMRLALHRAKMTAEEIDYVNTHGTSTHHGDIAETNAIKSVFNKHAYDMNINSTKSMIGHLLGASGGVEFIVTTLTLNKGIVHPTVNQEEPDPECDLNYTPNEAQRREVRTAISNSFGFGGHNVSILVKKYIE